MVERTGNTKNVKRATAASLMALSFLNLASSAVSPILASVEQAFPDFSASMVAMLTTLPPLLAIPTTLICGNLAGKRVKFRTLSLTGLILLLISGVAPWYTDHFYLLLFWRALFGLAEGILLPVVMPVMMAIFRGEEVHEQASKNAMSQNIGAVMFQMLGGVTCAKWGWKSTFLIYIVIFPVTILIWRLMPEPQIMSEKEKKIKIPVSTYRPVFKWAFLQFLHMILFYVAVTETSSVIMESGYGTSTTAAVILSLITASGVAGGWLYQKLKGMRRRILCIAYLFLSIGYLFMMLCTNVWIMSLGAIVIGIGFGIHIPAIQVFIGWEVPGYARGTAASIWNIFSSVGSFVSKFVLDGIMAVFQGSGGRTKFFVCFLAYLMLAAGWFLFVQHRKPTFSSMNC